VSTQLQLNNSNNDDDDDDDNNNKFLTCKKGVCGV
jgi:hypothetical protein